MAPPGLPSCGTDDVQATGKEGHRLVTNAVVHGAPPIRLSAIPLGTHLLVEVSDARPNLGRPAPDSGLRVVDELAVDWGIDYGRDGKMIWAAIPR